MTAQVGNDEYHLRIGNARRPDVHPDGEARSCVELNKDGLAAARRDVKPPLRHKRLLNELVDVVGHRDDVEPGALGELGTGQRTAGAEQL